MVQVKTSTETAPEYNHYCFIIIVAIAYSVDSHGFLLAPSHFIDLYSHNSQLVGSRGVIDHSHAMDGKLMVCHAIHIHIVERENNNRAYAYGKFKCNRIEEK